MALVPAGPPPSRARDRVAGGKFRPKNTVRLGEEDTKLFDEVCLSACMVTLYEGHENSNMKNLGPFGLAILKRKEEDVYSLLFYAPVTKKHKMKMQLKPSLACTLMSSRSAYISERDWTLKFQSSEKLETFARFLVLARSCAYQREIVLPDGMVTRVRDDERLITQDLVFSKSGKQVQLNDQVKIKVKVYEAPTPFGVGAKVSTAEPKRFSVGGTRKIASQVHEALVGMRKKGKRVVMVTPLSEKAAGKWRPPVPAETPLLVEITCLSVKAPSGEHDEHAEARRAKRRHKAKTRAAEREGMDTEDEDDNEDDDDESGSFSDEGDDDANGGERNYELVAAQADGDDNYDDDDADGIWADDWKDEDTLAKERAATEGYDESVFDDVDDQGKPKSRKGSLTGAQLREKRLKKQKKTRKQSSSDSDLDLWGEEEEDSDAELPSSSKRSGGAGRGINDRRVALVGGQGSDDEDDTGDVANVNGALVVALPDAETNEERARAYAADKEEQARRADPARRSSLVSLLLELDMEEYIDAFQAEDVRKDDLLHFSEQELAELVPRLGPRKRLTGKIRELKQKPLLVKMEKDEEEVQGEFEQLFMGAKPSTALVMRKGTDDSDHSGDDDDDTFKVGGAITRSSIEAQLAALPQEAFALTVFDGVAAPPASAHMTIPAAEYREKLEASHVRGKETGRKQLDTERGKLARMSSAVQSARKHVETMQAEIIKLETTREMWKEKSEALSSRLKPDQLKQVMTSIFTIIRKGTDADDIYDGSQILALCKKALQQTTATYTA